MVEGRIIKALSGFYYVASEGGVIDCKARGRFRLEERFLPKEKGSRRPR